MIISKTPYRISLFGGSTDYESFYSKHGSLLVGFAIDKYCYITFRHNPNIFNFMSKISYAQLEIVNRNIDIQHNGVRGVLEYFDLINERLEISCLNDLPSQTGIGSSSSFIVGLINAIQHKKKYTPKQLAQYAIDIERKHLKETGGIQDQIWAAYGGINSIHIDYDGSFFVKPLPISEDFIQYFLDHSFLIYTGSGRKSFKISSSHDTGSNDMNKHRILEISNEGYDAFCNEDIQKIGSLLRESWLAKKKISNLICNQKTDNLINQLYSFGMIGGKLIGSGGSGFIYGLTKDKQTKDIIKQSFFKNFIDFNISKPGSIIINE
jgi:D-glycero-alpha-D-manno-heptose-7-phosphate kinase